MFRPVISPVILLAVLLALGTVQAKADPYLGYVEADFVRASATATGKLVSLSVNRGQKIAVGDRIGQLDAVYETAQLAEAKARLAQAEAQAADLERARRAPEIAALEAQKRQAVAQAALSKAQVLRRRELVKDGAIARETLDQAEMAFTRDNARVSELDQQLDLARESSGRDAAIAAARAAVDAARASLAQAQWRLDERDIKAQAAGVISDVIYRPGETVPAGSAIALIISPEFLKARFFAPQSELARLAPGTSVEVACDGCAKPYPAFVTYVASDAEFTPPVIFSDQARQKLVFLIEAKMRGEVPPIQPGQPIQVRLAKAPAP